MQAVKCIYNKVNALLFYSRKNMQKQMIYRNRIFSLKALLYHLFWEARFFWWTLFGLVIAWDAGWIVAGLISVPKGGTEPALRIMGLFLQVFGIGTVAYGIHETRMLFGRPGIFPSFLAWLNRVLISGGHIVSGENSDVIGTLSGTFPAMKGNMRGHWLESAAFDASIEKRIEALEQNIEHINSRINQTQAEMDQNFGAQTAALEQEKQVRTEQDQYLSSKLEVTETGGINISVMGLIWLLFGVISSTISVELAAYFK